MAADILAKHELNEDDDDLEVVTKEDEKLTQSAPRKVQIHKNSKVLSSADTTETESVNSNEKKKCVIS